VIRPLETRDVEVWAAMRARLWPHADAEDLLREAYAFIEDEAASFLDAVFIAEDDTARPAGFLELSVRDFADGCDSAPVPHVEGWYIEPPARGLALGAERADLAPGEEHDVRGHPLQAVRPCGRRGQVERGALKEDELRAEVQRRVG